MPNYHPVFDNRISFVRSLGFSEYDVPQDGLSDDGIMIVGAWPDRGRVIEAVNAITCTLIPWRDDETRLRFREAQRLDYEATNDA